MGFGAGGAVGKVPARGGGFLAVSGASATGGDLALAVAEGRVEITLPGGLDRVVAALEVGVSRAAVGDLARGGGFLAASGAA